LACEVNSNDPAGDQIEQNDSGFSPNLFVELRPDGELISRLGLTLDRDEYDKMLDEYYQLRGWNIKTGQPTAEKLNGLGLKELVPDLERQGLVK